MEVRIRHGEGKLTEAFARSHRVVCDQPFDDHGSDTGMTPPELMLSALGCCAMHYAAEYLRARSLSSDGVTMRVSAAKGGHPARLIDIAIEVDAPGLIPGKREGLMKTIDACLLHRTLINAPEVKISMTTTVTETPLADQPFSLSR